MKILYIQILNTQYIDFSLKTIGFIHDTGKMRSKNKAKNMENMRGIIWHTLDALYRT